LVLNRPKPEAAKTEFLNRRSLRAQRNNGVDESTVQWPGLNLVALSFIEVALRLGPKPEAAKTEFEQESAESSKNNGVFDESTV
jgi:hypothetical protein